jgi:ferredoxin-like protein FixX
MPGARLDPFSTRLLAIHRQTRSIAPAPSTDAIPEEVHDALDAATTILEPPAAETTHELHALPVESTGCLECGGSDVKTTATAEELRQEIASIKERLATLEAQVTKLGLDVGPAFR